MEHCTCAHTLYLLQGMIISGSILVILLPISAIMGSMRIPWKFVFSVAILLLLVGTVQWGMVAWKYGQNGEIDWRLVFSGNIMFLGMVQVPIVYYRVRETVEEWNRRRFG